ncbi:MAG: iron-containing alcohol dehydrogenase [Thermodesulfobacteriota bacterium]
MDFLRTYQVRFPKGIHFGLGMAEKIGEIIRSFGAKKALVVTDKNLETSGIISKISKSINDTGSATVLYDQVVTEPTTDYVEEGLNIYQREKCDLVIGLGGGSCLDAAKGVALLATNGGMLQDYEGRGKVKKPKAPLVAIPTTAGTGSEVSWGAVFTDKKRQVKFIVHSPLLIPEEAIEDPLLTLSMPPSITASTGMDALTHAIEGFISWREANLGYGPPPLTHYFALPAIELISQNLRQAWANGRDIAARSNMLLGQLLAGFTFGNTGTALAHGMARPLGAYFHVPHGLANAIVLPKVMEYTWVAVPDKFAQIARAMGEEITGLSLTEAAQRAVEAVKKLCRDIRIPRLSDLSINREEYQKVIEQMAKDGLDSGTPQVNPRWPTKKEIVDLFNLIYD